MNRSRTWFAVAALATSLAIAPIGAFAQEAAPADTDPLIIIGWEDNDGGPIMGHASDIEALQQARARAQQQAQLAADPDLQLAVEMNDGAQ